MGRWNIPAVKTYYNGYRFRSRLEARWAVFFDTLGLKWEYEPEQLEVGKYIKMNYIPDFYLVGRELNVEIKGCVPNEMELRKAAGLAHDYEPVIILYGDIADHKIGCYARAGGLLMFRGDDGTVTLYRNYGFAECPKCKTIDIGQDIIPDFCNPERAAMWGVDNPCFSRDDLAKENCPDGRRSERILAAYDRAIRYHFDARREVQGPLRNDTFRPPTEKMIRYALSLADQHYGYGYYTYEELKHMHFDDVRDLISSLKEEAI